MDPRFCGEPCRWKHARLPAEQRCVACGRALEPAELATGRCGDLTCRRKVLEEFPRDRWLQRRARLLEQAERLRDETAQDRGEAQPETYPLTLIPSIPERVVNLSERRRRAFRDHLNRLIVQAGARPLSDLNPDTPPPEPKPLAARSAPVLTVLARACALCQGQCCQGGGVHRGGGTHAYLTTETIRRALRRGRRPREILDDYLSHVPHKTYPGSCVYHARDGCALPRDLRADMCNRYFCDELVDFSKTLTSNAAVRGFFAAVEGETIVRAAFLNETSTRRVWPADIGTST